MKKIIYLLLLVITVNNQAIAEGCAVQDSFYQGLAQKVDENSLFGTDATIKQLLEAGSISQKQVLCIEEKLKRLIESTNEINVTAQQNGSTIGVNESKISTINSTLSEIDKELNQKLYKINQQTLGLNQLITDNQSNIESNLETIKEEYNKSDADLIAKLNNLNQLVSEETSKLDSVIKQLKVFTNETGNNLEKLSTDTSGNVLRLDDYIRYLVIAIGIMASLLIISFFAARLFTVNKGKSLLASLDTFKQDVETNILTNDKKLAELLELLSNNINSQKSSDEDHSLALKVADEIVRIDKNTTKMDAKTKGLKQLVASVKRIQDNFAANGYEIVKMLNQPYDERMKVSASFVPSDELETDEQIITKIIKPQVNYKGTMVQSAQIEVSIGE